MSRAVFRFCPLPEVRVHAQIVADTVLPPVIVRTKVREILTGKSTFYFPGSESRAGGSPDPLVDLRDCQGGFVSERQSDQVSVGVVRLSRAQLPGKHRGFH